MTDETQPGAEVQDFERAAARAADDLENNTLEKMPGRFSRLVYLASLRDYNTGRYHHYGLETRYPAIAVDAAVHRLHIKVFEDLVSLPIAEQTQDLIGFFESLREDRTRLIETWRRLRSYQVLPPDNCHPLARQLFDKNIEVVLAVLRETDLWAVLYEAHSNPNHLP